MIVLGQQVKDRVTGFRGIVVARTEFLYASPQVRLQAETVKDDGSPKDPIWFEEAQVEGMDPVSHVPHFERNKAFDPYRDVDPGARG